MAKLLRLIEVNRHRAKRDGSGWRLNGQPRRPALRATRSTYGEVATRSVN